MFSRFNYLNKYVALLSLIVLNLILRIPIDREYGGDDTTFIAWMAESIITFGSVKWLIHPASVFGLAQLSYPSFVPIFLSIFSNVTGLTISNTVLSISLIYGSLGVIFAYLLGYILSRNINIALLTAFAFSINPRFLDYSRVGTSTRILFLLFFIFLFILILKYEETHSLKYGILILIISLSELMIHRMSIFLLGILILSYVCERLYTILLKNSGNISTFIKKNEAKILMSVLLIAFLFSFTPFYPFKSFYLGLEKGFFFNGTSRVVMFLNLVIDFIVQLNPFVLPLSFIGVYIFLNDCRTSFSKYFIFFNLLFYMPILVDSYYGFHYILPFAMVFFAIGTNHLISKIKNDLFNNIVLITLFLLIVSFSLFYSTPIKDEIFYQGYLSQPTMSIMKNTNYINSLNGNIQTDSPFVSRIFMLYNIYKPTFPFTTPEYSVYYHNKFANATFVFNLKSFLKTRLTLWFLNQSNLEKYNLDRSLNYIYKSKNIQHPGKDNRIFDNSYDQLYKINFGGS